EITPALLPPHETSRTVSNVGVFFAGAALPRIAGSLASSAVTAGAAFETDGGLAHSNKLTAPASSTIAPPPSPLDPLAAGAPDQPGTVHVPTAKNAGLDRHAIADVWLALEYTATPA